MTYMIENQPARAPFFILFDDRAELVAAEDVKNKMYSPPPLSPLFSSLLLLTLLQEGWRHVLHSSVAGDH